MNTTNILRPYFILILGFAFFAAGCKKHADETPVIEVSDYASSQPIAGAEIWKTTRSGFDLTCSCYMNITRTQMGATDGNGQFRGDLAGDIEIIQTGYFPGDQKYNYSIYEENGGKRYYRLYREATINIIKNPSNNYTEPILELGVILKDGTIKTLDVDKLILLNSVPNTNNILKGAIGDLQNRIIVRNGSNILLQTDILVQANTTKQITLNY